MEKNVRLDRSNSGLSLLLSKLIVEHDWRKKKMWNMTKNYIAHAYFQSDGIIPVKIVWLYDAYSPPDPFFLLLLLLFILFLRMLCSIIYSTLSS